jgi:hypothetical protein
VFSSDQRPMDRPDGEVGERRLEVESADRQQLFVNAIKDADTEEIEL